jgi:hypothetical protein
MVVIASVGGLIAERRYLDNRYATSATARDALFVAARQFDGNRIGVVGFPLTYPFYGASFDNPTAYVGEPGPHHEFTDYRTCQGWLGALAAAKVNDVVVLAVPGGDSYARFSRWTAAGGGAPVVQNPAGSIYRMAGSPDPLECP